MHAARTDDAPASRAKSGAERPTWVRRLGLVALTLLIVVALVAMEVFSLLLLDLLR